MGFSDPVSNIEQLHLREGMTVADLGAGTGAYAVAAARKVGSSGRVYAVDVQKELLTKVKTLAQSEGIGTIEVVWGDIEEPGGTKLADMSVDAVVLSNVLFQVEDRAGLMKEAARILRPGGSVLLVDWTESFGGLGPQEGDVFPAHEAKALAGSVGLAFERTIDAGEHHYGLVLTKPQ